MTHEEQILATLKEIRDDQREVIEMVRSQMKISEARLEKADKSMAESIGLQRRAVKSAKLAALVAIPIIIAGIATIAYLLINYF